MEKANSHDQVIGGIRAERDVNQASSTIERIRQHGDIIGSARPSSTSKNVVL